MSSNVFYQNLNEFCRKYLISGSTMSQEDIRSFEPSLREIEAEIFENLLLFDKVTFKVYGENIPLAVLVNLLGTKGVEQLAEQNAVGFTLWTPGVFFLKDEIEGVDPIASMVHSSAAHSDPEQSLDLGLHWLRDKLKRSERRSLIRKLRDLYRLPDKKLPADSVAFTKSAYLSGKLAQYGLNPNACEFHKIPTQQKRVLAKCAEDLLQYSYLLSEGMTSFSNFRYYEFFSASKKSIVNADHRIETFCHIANLERFPDLKTLYKHIPSPWERLANVRRKSASKKFRNWLEKTDDAEGLHDVSAEYIAAISQPTGFYTTWKGKLTKTIISSSIGAGIGTLLAGPLGAVLGTATAKTIEPITDKAIDLVDDFLLDGLTKGWTPRLFVQNLGKVYPEVELLQGK